MARLALIVVILVLALLVRGVSYFASQHAIPDQALVKFQSDLRTDPRDLGFSQGFSVFTPQAQRVYVSTSRFPEYHYGQRLELVGRISTDEHEDGSRAYYMNYPEITIVKEYANPLFFLTYSYRERVTEIFQRFLPYPYSSILMGIVFGVREGMPEELTDAFIKTGVIHITAASGMNVTMLAGAVCVILSGFMRRQKALLIAIGAIWFYAGVAGFDASITRASLMATIAFSAGLLGRQNTGWYALFLTGFVMVFINPQIIYDLGFQLSFTSTAGILFLIPFLPHVKRSELKIDDAGWFLTDDFKTTVAAQIATIPILLTQFNEISLLSIPINMLILWTIPPLMALGGVAGIVGIVAPVLSAPFLYLALPLLWYVEAVVMISASIIPSFRVESFPIGFSIVYYCVLVFLVLRIGKSR